MKIERQSPKRFIDTDTIFSAIITAFFLVLFCATFSMQEVSTYLLPRVLAATGIIIGVAVLLVKFVRSHRSMQDSDTKGDDRPSEDRGLSVFYTVLLTVIYFVLAKYLGFMLTTFIAIIVFSFLLRLRNKVVIVSVAVILPVVLHSLFVTLLKVNLPEGILSSVLPF